VGREPGEWSIYYVHPLQVSGHDQWQELFLHIKHMKFGAVCVAPLFASGLDGDVFLTSDFDETDPRVERGTTVETVRALAALCADLSLKLYLDFRLNCVAADGVVARERPDLFSRSAGNTVVDPRQPLLPPNAAATRFGDPDLEKEIVQFFAQRMLQFAKAGASGFRLVGLEGVSPRFIRALIKVVRDEFGDRRFLGWTPGLSWPVIAALEPCGLDAVFASTPWWDRHHPWLVEEYNLLRQIAPVVIGMPEAPFEERFASRAPATLQSSQLALRTAVATGSSILVPMGFEFGARRRMNPKESDPNFETLEAEAAFDLSDDIRAANELSLSLQERGTDGAMHMASGPGPAVATILRADAPDMRAARHATLVLINSSATVQEPPTTNPLAFAGAAFANPEPVEGGDVTAALAPHEVRIVSLTHTRAVADRSKRGARQLTDALKSPRIALERLSPSIDNGCFPIKRVVGERVTVEVDIITDGHEIVAAELLWKAVDEKTWIRATLRQLGNDRWRGEFAPTRVGRHLFTVEAWRDDYATLAHEIEVKHDAGVDISSELLEVQGYLEIVRRRAVPCNSTAIDNVLRKFGDDDAGETVHGIIEPSTICAVANSAERAFAIQHDPIPLEVERPQAAFASWYELFPRSQSGDVNRHGTFSDVIGRLPSIRRMGFDVLYFPPIHPIGQKNRKGRNNTLTPGPDDVGSPYAIGSPEGGHDAIHPQLGTLEDFRRLVAAARENGLEIALDFAIQCSPDHPWLRDHPEWFKWRPDGSIKYAENPPKKYQDIVNVDFYGEGASGLWAALRTIVLYWAGEGVRIFRVDNPHTKPLPFWQWMIADVKAVYPDVIFLSEAFTRPKMMYRLAKVGFSQSYTYFTWRNTKDELTKYLTELTTTEVKEFFRPNFFVNTPDINPYFLQTSGRPGFLIRAVLAATLSGLWGIYSGFENCESAALPGREEYLDSEKYEIRVRDEHAPGNIVEEITQLNRLRRSYPALQSHLGVKFYNAFNEQVLLFGKMSPGREDMILVAVNLDPHHAQEATFELPLWEWKLPDHGRLLIEDPIHDQQFVWTGKLQKVRLDPGVLPYAVWRVAPPEGAA
jgi:starch synthase (maltosyl-transferring)